MKIDLLSRIIKELIRENDTVALPGLGVFVSEFVPASFSDKGNVINPPYRRLLFRERSCDDGLIAGFYARYNEVSVKVASEMLETLVDEIRRTIGSKRLVEFPGLGKLRATKEKTIFFIADDSLDIYPDAYGLQSIYIRNIGQEPDEVEAIPENVQPVDVVVDTVEEEPVVDGVQEPVMEETAVDDNGDTDVVKRNRVWVFVLAVVCGVLALVLVFILLCHLFPESAFIDKLFYDEQELEILRWIREGTV